MDTPRVVSWEASRTSRDRSSTPIPRMRGGGEEFLGGYRYLDVTPKGRMEEGPYRSLSDWARPRNMYGNGGMVQATGRYHEPACACADHRA
jgi:predicted dithiol-disulfide oxidoreductase (DUF899 family)